jgi:hypothetical protein
VKREKMEEEEENQEKKTGRKFEKADRRTKNGRGGGKE